MWGHATMALMTLKEIPKKVETALEKYGPLTKRLLFNRDILTGKDAEEFLNPSYEEHVYDPYLMKNMDLVVERIYQAIKNDEKIEGKDPIAWAVIKGKGIGDQSLSPADYCKSIDIDMLPHLASEYKRGTLEQDTAMNKAYEGYRGNQVIPTPAIDALLQGNPKTVARLINKLSKSGKDTSISLEAITNNCSLDTLYKMAQIGDQIEERAKTNKITKFFYDQLDKFTNSIKKSDNVKNSKIKAALIELSNMQSLTRSKEVKKDKLHNIIKELAQKTPARASQTSIKPTHPKSLTI